ncbi:Pvc16 family protein [Streptomyces sp. NPDC048636]|uniref:Pvc16 family protein n=1 Tax=Streptomyces sp. NPDC048636 TaxID=3155762 RepID=UPI003426F54F
MDSVTHSLAAWLELRLPDSCLHFGAPRGESGEHDAEVCLSALLYDVREEPHRESGEMYVRNAEAMAVGRVAPTRLFRYSYRLTAHAPSWQVAQRLLGEVMCAAVDSPAIPGTPPRNPPAGRPPLAMPLIVAPPDAVDFPWCAHEEPAASSPPLHLALLAPLRPRIDIDVEAPPQAVDIGLGTLDGQPPRRRARSLPRPRISE